MTRRHEKPLKRTNPSGKPVFVARWTDHNGKRTSAGTFKLQGPCRTPDPDGACCAQHAIDAAYDRDAREPRTRSAHTVGDYAATWLDRHPRTDRTAHGYRGRLRIALAVRIDGTAFADMPLADVRRRHANAMIGVLLSDQGRAAKGAKGIIAVVRAMFSDALDDEHVEHNPFMGVRISAKDPRVSKAARKPQVWTWEQMHGLARAAARAHTEPPVRRVHGERHVGADPPVNAWRPVYAEPMLRVLSDCGLRLGELFALERRDLKGEGRCDEMQPVPCPCAVPHLHVRRRAWDGAVLAGTKDRDDPGRERVAVVPDALYGLLTGLPPRIDTPLLFPSPEGAVWQLSSFYTRVWYPACKVFGAKTNPHSFRHSYVSLLRAAGVDAFDLALRTGHTEATASAIYTHPLGRSDEAIRRAVGP